jgi:hygromycin-B 4-O-kinase
MESVKPAFDQESILALLRENFDLPIQELTPVQGGLVAQTLSFRVNEKEYILRFTSSSMDASYQKEAFIYKHFSSPDIPIPSILKVGRLGKSYYAIFQKMPGRELDSLSQAEYQQALPSIIQTLHSIHQVNVQEWCDFGWLDDHGMGMFPSWEGFIAKIIEEERPDGFYGKWHNLFSSTFLERDFFETVYKQMLRLLEYCPEERHLVHGGYGYKNVLAQEGKVTAVSGWFDAMYGDFVYDIAWIDSWPPHGIDYGELCHQYYAGKGIPLPNYRERMTCYKLYSGLDGLRFFAKTNNRKSYQSVCQKLQKLLNASSIKA